MNWIRTSKKVRCPICLKDSWCILNPEKALVLCMRVASAKPKAFCDGQVGYLHPLDPDQKIIPPAKSERAPPTINCRKLIETWTNATTQAQLLELSQDLQVTVHSLSALQVCWSPENRAWAIPMTNGYGNMVGIRLRSNNGAKWAVRGSHSGCFIASRTRPQPLALVAEGFSDTAAGLDLGFYTVGRPSCSGGIPIIQQFFRMNGVRKAVIVADNDGPGVAGAKMLSSHLRIPNCTIIPPCKDLRSFLQAGGTKELIESLISQSIWNHGPNQSYTGRDTV